MQNSIIFLMGLMLLVAVGSVSSASHFVCVNKTELEVPINVTFTSSGANLTAKQTGCQMQRTSDPSTIVAQPGDCRSLGEAVSVKADVLSMRMSSEVASGKEGYASFDLASRTIVVRCYVSP